MDSAPIAWIGFVLVMFDFPDGPILFELRGSLLSQPLGARSEGFQATRAPPLEGLSSIPFRPLPQSLVTGSMMFHSNPLSLVQLEKDFWGVTCHLLRSHQQAPFLPFPPRCSAAARPAARLR